MPAIRLPTKDGGLEEFITSEPLDFPETTDRPFNRAPPSLRAAASEFTPESVHGWSSSVKLQARGSQTAATAGRILRSDPIWIMLRPFLVESS